MTESMLQLARSWSKEPGDKRREGLRETKRLVRIYRSVGSRGESKTITKNDAKTKGLEGRRKGRKPAV